MARKVFISFLGATDYSECYYVKKEGGKETFVSSHPMRFIQEATLDYLEKEEKWTSEDVALILLTSIAEKTNWNDDGQKNFKTGEMLKRKGLHSCLKERDSLIQIKTIPNIVMGEEEKDLWTIFSTIFNEINSKYRGCELYFDLTHSFRYLPMLFLVLANYLKFMSDVKVKGIYYGNFESRDKETNKAPILDLLPISNLQDWTYAAASYKENGLADRLCDLAEKEIRYEKRTNVDARNNDALRALQDFMKDLRDNSLSHLLCRGNEILDGKILKDMHSKKEKINFEEYTIPPLEAVVEDIYDSMNEYTIKDDKVAENLIEASYWCFCHNMYQQSATLLQEGIVTYVCVKNGLDETKEKERSCVNAAFRYMVLLKNEEKNRARDISQLPMLEELTIDCLIKHIPELLSKYNVKDEFTINNVSKLLFLPIINDLCNEFESCRKLRNDFNHAGFDDQHSESKELIKKTKNNIEKCRAYIYKK